MDNKTALILAMLIVAVFLADRFYFGWGLMTMAGQKLIPLTEYLAFWR